MKELARKPFSKHPDDHYLAVVLRTDADQSPVEPFFTHLENSSGARPFYVEGRYFKSEAEALADFNKRGK